MYNFNDLRVCFAPYRCNNRNGIIIGIIPMDITSNTELLHATEKCMYSDEVYEFIKSNRTAKDWFYKIREYTSFQMVFRAFRLNGYTILAIEAPGAEEDSKNVSSTWREAANKMIAYVEMEKHMLTDYDRINFASSVEEYKFYITAIRLGTIDVLHMISDNGSKSLLLNAFIKAYVYRRNYFHVHHASPSFTDVIKTREIIKKRWGLPVKSEIGIREDFIFKNNLITKNKKRYRYAIKLKESIAVPQMDIATMAPIFLK